MKIFKFTLLLIFLFFIKVNFSQGLYRWDNSSEGDWNTASNWEFVSGTPNGNGYPEANDDAIFTEDDITVFLPPLANNAQVASVNILNGSDIYFENGYINVLENFVVSDNSIIHLISVNNAVIFINDTADIYGLVEAGNFSGIAPQGTNADILFHEGSIYIAGTDLDHPFQYITTLPNTVTFENGSTYRHYGGTSPVGDDPNDVVNFDPESNYEIYVEDHSLLLFSGNTFGNISVHTSEDIINDGTAAIPSVFIFNTLTTVDKGFSFIGTLHDAVEITGNLINASGGDIIITAGDYITFSNNDGPVILQGNNNINFSLNESADFNFIESGTELILETDINIDVIPGDTAYYEVNGIIDCDDFNIIPSPGAYLTLEENSVLKTAHSGGVTGSIPNIEIMSGAKIEYNRTEGNQVTGLTDISNSFYLSEMKIYNPYTVTLDNKVEVYILNLNNGNFNIDDETLIINGHIDYGEGILSGNSENSRLEIISTDGLGFELRTSLDLNDLVIDGTDILLSGDGTLTIDHSLELNYGRLNINNSTLKFGDNAVISSVNNSSSYIIAENEGFVKKVFSLNGDEAIPIGTSDFYSEVTIIPDSNIEYYINVFDSVYSNGRDGQQYTYDMLNMTWNINSVTDTDAKLEIYWDNTSNIKLSGFDDDNAFISYFNNNTRTWDNQPALSFSISSTPPLTGIYRNINNNGLYCVASSIVNNEPVAEDQVFIVPEHSPNGTIVGTIEVSDPDPGQVLTVNLITGSDINPFGLNDDFTITVRNTELLERSNFPFEYDLEVCDNAKDAMHTPFHITVNFEEVYDELVIANYLSPNHDNLNDTWKIKGIEPCNIDVFIYSNTGNLVYESKGYRSDWDGTSKGSRLPAGVYYYIVKTDMSEYKGTITLVR
ncbi:MAG: gliding motility-associated C-terminal domain-containing protein [Bacteroidales bacterium]|nr:gliding motility-associated C-terminal domain-containing protein [Bacteroidales bacterium]